MKREVRAWLREQGIEVGTRGRFSAKQVDDFQKATGKVYVKGYVEPRTIKGTRVNPETGRKTPVQVKATDAEVRAWAQAEGLAAGSRGRLPQAVLSAFAARPKAAA